MENLLNTLYARTYLLISELGMWVLDANFVAQTLALVVKVLAR